ncbi:MAG: FkbM family methyltransferase [Microgenomates group bacterium]
MPSNISKNSATSPSLLQQISTKYKIYGFWWTIRLTAQFLYRKIFFELLRHSYSQYGEDLIIASILNKKNIYYVDIGANHPQKFNNTFMFYRHGSSGINIEPNKSLLSQYFSTRPRDLNLNLAISDKNTSLIFYNMYPDVNSTISKTQYLHTQNLHSLLINKQKIKVKTLQHTLHKYLPTNQPIDLLCIDTEGHDYQVLKSNDWSKYSPTVICIETQLHGLEQQYLLKLGYLLYAQTSLNSIYLKKDSSLFSLPTPL